MLRKKLWKLLVIVGIFGSLMTGGGYLCVGYQNYSEVVTSNEMQNDLMLPTARVKVEIEYQGRMLNGFGSGAVIYSQPNEFGTGYDTYFLTCNHVIELPIFDESQPIDPFNGPKVKDFAYACKYVEFFDKFGNSLRKVPARVIAHSNNMIMMMDSDGNMLVDRKSKDETTGQYHGEDYALLKLEVPEAFPVVKMPSRATLEALKVFDKVRVVGAALGDKPIPTFGEITRIDIDFIAISAPAIFGNSGGPVFLDKTHEMIGILNMGRGTQGGFVTHMCFIRPLVRIYDCFDSLGYKFIYDKSIPVVEKFNTIRKDADKQRFKVIDDKAQLDRLVKDLIQKIALIGDLSQKITSIETRLTDLEAKIAQPDIKKEVDSLKKEVEELKAKLNQANTEKQEIEKKIQSF